MNRKILVLYHYYFPDDVAGAFHFTGLCEGLVQRGFEVETWPSNRSCHHYTESYPLEKETVNGVTVRRVWRPPFKQHSFLGRILNSLWMLKLWWWRLALTPGCRPDVILTGTDPIFTVLLHPFLKLLRPKAKIAHWCFDLYPEYAVADGIVRENNWIVKLLKSLMGSGYAKSDLIADLGSCMRNRLEKYPAQARATLTPWAQEEPTRPSPISTTERKELFGGAKLALLYSGNFGRPHAFELTLQLARKMRGKTDSTRSSGPYPCAEVSGYVSGPPGRAGSPSAVFAYSARGSRLDEFKASVTPEDVNIRFAPFAPPEKLAARLSAPDVHMVSLRPEATGVAVPSKFFGVLAMGRPVLFEGSEDACIAKWIEEYKVGWVLTPDNLDEIAGKLIAFSRDHAKKIRMFRHCHKIYQTHFSKKAVMNNWDKELRNLPG